MQRYPVANLLPDPHCNTLLLAQAVQFVRLHRGRSTADIAAALDLSLRTYERWESGDTALSFSTIKRFADVTDSDPIAFVVAMFIRDPEFAVDAADNKLALMVIMTLADLHAVAGDGLRHLSKTEIHKHLQVVLQALGTSSTMTEPAEQWMTAHMNNWALRDLGGPVVPKRLQRSRPRAIPKK